MKRKRTQQQQDNNLPMFLEFEGPSLHLQGQSKVRHYTISNLKRKGKEITTPLWPSSIKMNLVIAIKWLGVSNIPNFRLLEVIELRITERHLGQFFDFDY